VSCWGGKEEGMDGERGTDRAAGRAEGAGEEDMRGGKGSFVLLFFGRPLMTTPFSLFPNNTQAARPGHSIVPRRHSLYSLFSTIRDSGRGQPVHAFNCLIQAQFYHRLGNLMIDLF